VSARLVRMLARSRRSQSCITLTRRRKHARRIALLLPRRRRLCQSNPAAMKEKAFTTSKKSCGKLVDSRTNQGQCANQDVVFLKSVIRNLQSEILRPTAQSLLVVHEPPRRGLPSQTLPYRIQ